MRCFLRTKQVHCLECRQDPESRKRLGTPDVCPHCITTERAQQLKTWVEAQEGYDPRDNVCPECDNFEFGVSTSDIKKCALDMSCSLCRLAKCPKNLW